MLNSKWWRPLTRRHWRWRCGWVLVALLMVGCVVPAASADGAADPNTGIQDPSATDLDGAWRADRYELAEGGSHPLAGHILFVDGEWNVLFYVLDGADEPVRFSAEGGTFTRNGNDLIFTHLYYAAKGEAVTGLTEAPFEMRVNRGEPVVEPSSATVEGDRLTLHFPSGNRMTFNRNPGA